MLASDNPCFRTTPSVFSIWKSPLVLQKTRMKIVVRAIYTYIFFLYIHCPPLLEKKLVLIVISVFARKEQCVHCNSYVRQNLRVRCSLNFEFGTYDVMYFNIFKVNKVT